MSRNTAGGVGAARYVLDPSCRVLDDGTVLLGGSPLKLFRLGARGARVIAAIRDGEPLPPGHEPLTRRLVEAGAAHPLPDPAGGPTPTDVTLVIPAYRAAPTHPDSARRDDRPAGGDPAGRNDGAATDALAEGEASGWDLAALIRATGARAAIVVDDASPIPVGPVEGAEVIRLDENAGPGAARMAGLEHVTTPFVAFLDTDTDAPEGWLAPLLAHFADERVAAVTPRIRSIAGPGLLARFDHWRSPLDLGPERGMVRVGTRIAYVPSTALVARVSALREVGGFDRGMRVGEDVDLVWRLDEAGWAVRYEPASIVAHAPRPDARSWLRQRFTYGTSAAPLERRHPGALAPARLNRWSAIAWATAIVSPPAGVAVAGVTTALLARKLSAVRQPGRLAARLGGLGHLYAGRLLAGAVARAWLPLAVVPALVSRRARRVLAAALVVPPLLDWLRDRPAIDPARAVLLRIAEDTAYSAGLWQGMVAERSLDAIRPELTTD